MDALTHALESYLSRRANPWADGIALQVIRMVSAYLPRAVRGRRGPGGAVPDAAGRAPGRGRHGQHRAGPLPRHRPLPRRRGSASPHGVALSLVLPQVLRFNLAACEDRLADVAFALGAGDTARDPAGNAAAAIDAITGLPATAGPDPPAVRLRHRRRGLRRRSARTPWTTRCWPTRLGMPNVRRHHRDPRRRPGVAAHHGPPRRRRRRAPRPARPRPGMIRLTLDEEASWMPRTLVPCPVPARSALRAAPT